MGNVRTPLWNSQDSDVDVASLDVRVNDHQSAERERERERERVDGTEGRFAQSSVINLPLPSFAAKKNRRADWPHSQTHNTDDFLGGVHDAPRRTTELSPSFQSRFTPGSYCMLLVGRCTLSLGYTNSFCEATFSSGQQVCLSSFLREENRKTCRQQLSELIVKGRCSYFHIWCHHCFEITL